MPSQKKKFPVVCFGSAVADIFLFSKGFKLLKTGSVDEKETAICLTYGGKVEVDSRLLVSGGGGTNTATGFARMGLKTAVVARMGQDPLGKAIVHELGEEKNLDIDWLATKKGDETDTSVILVGPDGGRGILVYRGRTRLTRADVPWSRLKADWFYVASLEGNLELGKELFGFARKNNIKVAWNPGKKELAQGKEVFSLLSQVDVILLNEEEARSLLNVGAGNFWQQVKQIPTSITAITQGRQGVTVFADGKRFRQSIFKVPVADETGAGDSFGCGLVTGLIKGFDIDKSISWGLANSASVVSQIGAKAGLLTHTAVENFISQRIK